MAAQNTLPFQYLVRGTQLMYLNGDRQAAATEQRDADLEDFLGHLADEIATGVVQQVVAGTNISVNNTDPTHPIVSSAVSQAGVDAVRWNSAWGQIAYVAITSDVTGIQNSPVEIMRADVTFVTGRRYEVTTDCFMHKAGADSAATVVVRLVCDVTPMMQRNLSMTAPGDVPLRVGWHNQATYGAHTVIVQATSQVGFVNVWGASGWASWLSICDIGPVTPV